MTLAANRTDGACHTAPLAAWHPVVRVWFDCIAAGYVTEVPKLAAELWAPTPRRDDAIEAVYLLAALRRVRFTTQC